MLENHFDGEAATRYDEFAPAPPGAMIDVLAEMAGAGGRALELAIGTGRVGLPLAERGVRVAGIELSPAMVEQLVAKPGAEAIEVEIGDMTTTRVGGAGAFDLAYLVFNTIGNVETQDRQVACFENAAAHLRPGGHFVIECVVPDLRRLVPGHDAIVFQHARGYVGYDRYDDLVNQHAVSHHFLARDGDVHESTTPFRFVWPSELDLMARLAGMHLVHRWADWDRSLLTADSASHVSVWQRGQGS